MKVDRYVIRRQDRYAAIVFIEQQLGEEMQWIESKHALAKQEYLDSLTDPEGINAWCVKWLNDGQWTQLRKAISAACGPQEKTMQIQPLQTVSLSYHAWQILADLAQQNGTTLSNVIISHLEKIHFATCTQSETDYNRNNRNHNNPALNT